MADKQDSFTPRRATSIDGFLTGAGQQPRRPAFRDFGGPQVPQPSQQSARKPVFGDAPKRADATTLHDGTLPSRPQPGASNIVNDGYLEPPRRQPNYGEAPKKATRRGLFGRREAEVEDYAAHRPKKKHRIRKVVGLLLLAVVVAFGARFYNDIARLTGNKNPLNVLGALRDAPLKNDNGRVNILVAGNSADDLGHNGAELTDSIMVISVDTKNNTAMMLSVPRDMWVQLPAGGHGKINSVYPDSGMEGLAKVIQDDLGLSIHYNVLVNYNAFKDLVDAVGGIQITIKSDNPKGIYDSSLDYTSRYCCALAKYPNGPVTLNGKQALNLARARGEGYGSYGFPQADFDRTEHQRQMLLAIKDKASSASVIANPVKISNLVSAVGSNAKTDLSLPEMQSLYKVMKRIDTNKIDSFNVNTLKGPNSTMLQSYASPNGQSALIPAAGLDDYSDIAVQIKKTFTSSPVAKEAADIVVLNGTELPGLAKLESGKLDTKGTNTLVVANGTTHAKTVIIDNSGGAKPNTVAMLKARYGVAVTTDPAVTRGYPSADIIIVLGDDVAAKYQNPQTSGAQSYQTTSNTTGG